MRDAAPSGTTTTGSYVPPADHPEQDNCVDEVVAGTSWRTRCGGSRIRTIGPPGKRGVLRAALIDRRPLLQCGNPAARSREGPMVRIRLPPVQSLANSFGTRELSQRGLRPFARRPNRHAAGEQLIPAAESVEDAVLTLERRRAA